MPADPLLDDLDQQLAPLRRATAEARWRCWTVGGADAARALRRRQRDESALLAAPQPFSQVERALTGEEPGSLRHRRLQRTRLAMLPHQAPAAVGEEISEQELALEFTRARARFPFEGAEVDGAVLARILTRELDGDRRRDAWRAAREGSAALAPHIRALAHLRNERARSLGFPDHVALALHLAEIDPDRLTAVLDEVELRTAAPYARVRRDIDGWLARRYGVPEAALRPWHLIGGTLGRDPRRLLEAGGGAPIDLPDIEPRARQLLGGIGLPVDDRWASVHRPPGAPPLSQCLPVAPPGDVRVLLAPIPGRLGLATALHELGHALFAHHLPEDLPLLLREPASDALGEGVAMLLERLASPPGAGDVALFLRRALVVVRFEQALYADPDGDLDGHWWDLLEALQGIPRPPGPACADWAAEVHIAGVPVYYQHYILGERIAARLDEHLGERLGRPSEGTSGWHADPRAGDRLRALFRMGARYTAGETLRRWTEER